MPELSTEREEERKKKKNINNVMCVVICIQYEQQLDAGLVSSLGGTMDSIKMDIEQMNTREECSTVAKKIAGFDPKLTQEQIHRMVSDEKYGAEYDTRKEQARVLRRLFFQRTTQLRFHEDILENTLTRVFLNNECYGLGQHYSEGSLR